MKQILKMKGMGFSLIAIREVLAVQDGVEAADKVVVLNKVAKRLDEKEQEVAEGIRQMREEIGHAEVLLQELRCYVAFCARSALATLKA